MPQATARNEEKAGVTDEEVCRLFTLLANCTMLQSSVGMHVFNIPEGTASCKHELYIGRRQRPQTESWVGTLLGVCKLLELTLAASASAGNMDEHDWHCQCLASKLHANKH